MGLIEQGKDDSNQGDFGQTPKSKSENWSEGPLDKMQPDPKEENSFDHLDLDRRAEIASGYAIIFGADQYWI